MRTFITAIAFVFALAACSTSTTYKFSKYGFNQQELYKDDYRCRQESKLSSSAAFVGMYAGAASSAVEPDKQLWLSCMRAAGYTVEEVTR